MEHARRPWDGGHAGGCPQEGGAGRQSWCRSASPPEGRSRHSTFVRESRRPWKYASRQMISRPAYMSRETRRITSRSIFA